MTNFVQLTDDQINGILLNRDLSDTIYSKRNDIERKVRSTCQNIIDYVVPVSTKSFQFVDDEHSNRWNQVNLVFANRLWQKSPGRRRSPLHPDHLLNLFSKLDMQKVEPHLIKATKDDMLEIIRLTKLYNLNTAFRRSVTLNKVMTIPLYCPSYSTRMGEHTKKNFYLDKIENINSVAIDTISPSYISVSYNGRDVSISINSEDTPMIMAQFYSELEGCQREIIADLDRQASVIESYARDIENIIKPYRVSSVIKRR